MYFEITSVITLVYINWAYRNSWALDAGVGRWTLDVGLWTLDSGLWMLGSGNWTLDAGSWTLDVGRWTLDATLWTLGSGHRTLSLAVLEQNQKLVSDSA